MTASKRRVLINYLVTKAIEKVIKKDEMIVRYFIRTSSLIQWTKSKVDNLIKPQGIKNKIIIQDNYAQNEEIGEFTVPSTAVILQEENMGNITTDIIEDSINNIVGNINNLAIYKGNNEADSELHCEEVIEDVSVAESANKFDFQS